MIAIRTTRKSSAILVLIVCAACSEDHRPADSTAWRFRWNTNGKDYTCVVSDEMVGDVQMQSLRIPTPNGKISNLTFGGPNMDVLYATCGDKVYSRKVKVKGANAFEPPFKPAPPRL